MTRRNLLYPLLLLILGALFATAPFALGSPDAPMQDATDQAATVNALVEERFQQTLQANAPVQTATAEAMLTATIDAQATGTAGFQLTVDAAFAQAMTATAQGGTLVPLSGVQA